MRAKRHATFTGEQTLCGLYCGFHRPLMAVKPIQGWNENVTCKNCRKAATKLKREGHELLP